MIRPARAASERQPAPVVGELIVRNDGHEPALVLEGEVLEGGWQHRVAARSTMVGRRDTEVLAVHCVEQGRSSSMTSHLCRGRRAPLAVRAADGQDAVWRRVGRYGTSASGSLLEASQGAERAAARLVEGLAPLSCQAGVLVGVAGQPLLMEVFDSPDTLAAVWDRLLLAAATDAVTAPAVETPGRRARRFVRRLRDVRLDPAGAGRGIGGRGRSPYARLSTMTWHGRAVHTVAINTRHQLVAA